MILPREYSNREHADAAVLSYPLLYSRDALGDVVHGGQGKQHTKQQENKANAGELSAGCRHSVHAMRSVGKSIMRIKIGFTMKKGTNF